jgi:hypothetical protein
VKKNKGSITTKPNTRGFQVMTSRPLLVVIGILFFALSFSGGALAKEHQKQGNWQFNLAPFYLWAINIDGDLSTGTNKIPVDIPLSKPVEVPFDDVFDALEGVFIVHFEAVHKSNWGLLLDVDYLNLGNDFTNAQGIGLNVDFEVTLAEFAGLYRVKNGAHNFDALFGLRSYNMNPEVALLHGPTVVDVTQDWLDPFIGGRWIWTFTQGWSLIARGDIGGFGVGSDLSWQASGLIEWQPFHYVSFLAGYRALNIDYEDGSGNDFFKFDATVHGPLLGVNFKW